MAGGAPSCLAGLVGRWETAASGVLVLMLLPSSSSIEAGSELCTALLPRREMDDVVGSLLISMPMKVKGAQLASAHGLFPTQGQSFRFYPRFVCLD